MSDGQVTALKRVDAGAEVWLRRQAPFPVGGEMPVLKLGVAAFALSRFPDDGDTRTLIFTLSYAEWESVPDDVPVVVEQGPTRRWQFGTLDKSKLQ